MTFRLKSTLTIGFDWREMVDFKEIARRSLIMMHFPSPNPSMTSFEQPFSSDKRSTSFRRRFRKAFLLSSVIASGFAFNGVSYFGTGVFAQDPFDDLGSPPVPTAPSPKGVSSQGSGSPLDSNETNAVVRSLRANPPTTPKELGKAVELMKIGRAHV